MLWSSLTELTLHTALPEVSKLWENVGLDQQAPSPRSGTTSHLCLLPRDCSPLLLHQRVSGHLVAAAKAELVKTNTGFSFVGGMDSCPCTKTHRV